MSYSRLTKPPIGKVTTVDVNESSLKALHIHRLVRLRPPVPVDAALTNRRLTSYEEMKNWIDT